MSQGNLDVTQNPPPPIFRARGLVVGYRSGRKTLPVLRNLDLELRRGELVCLLGPNGAGKSTLIRTLAGLQPPLAGHMEWEGRDSAGFTPKEWARKVSAVLTDKVDAGNLSAYSLTALGRYPYTDWTGRLLPEDKEAIRMALEATGAWDLRDRFFDELSDGEKQKIMVARALAQSPALLLLDEPTAFLDLPRRVELMRRFRRLAREENRAVLLSTHDLDLAIRASDRIWLLSRDGAMVSGLPEDLALGGAYGAVFDQEDVVFDLEKGLFRIHDKFPGKACVDGDPTLVFWTERALEREGFSTAGSQVTADALKIRTGSNGSGKNRWELAVNDEILNFSTLEGLISAVRRLK